MTLLNKNLALCVTAVASLTACEAAFPGTAQFRANGPLIVDLDDSDPLVIGAESVAVVRGPDKGNGERGGFTASFMGIGGPMCVIVDPETEFDYFAGGTPDAADDGDTDLFVGRAADYTGTPGVTIGDFKGEYIDSLGIPHALDQNLCLQVDQFGDPGSHAGMAFPEFCTIQTDAATPYIIMGETFSVPIDDNLLTVAIQVDPAGCAAIDENTLGSDD